MRRSVPAFLSYGFRPFFLLGSLWAAASMLLWMLMLMGQQVLPTMLDFVSWHAHEFLFGYLSAIFAGFLLTAVANWTGRAPFSGRPLAALVALWLAGRVAVASSALLPFELVVLIDLAFIVALASVLAREIISAHNWRNLIVLVVLGVFFLGNLVFHWESRSAGHPASGFGLRLGVAAAVMMITVIGGRIVPSFTSNYLAGRPSGRMPVLPMQPLDSLSLVALVLALLLWVLAPRGGATGGMLVLAGVMHLARLVRWAGHRTFAEPLVLVLHVGYAFVPLGALVLGVQLMWRDTFSAAPIQHLWMSGAIGLMTLAMMTRATLGHTDQELKASAGTAVLYVVVFASTLLRIVADYIPSQTSSLYMASGAMWVIAFGGFALLYGRLLILPRQRFLAKITE